MTSGHLAAIGVLCGRTDDENSLAAVERVVAERDQLRAALDAARAERDAYKKAKAENDERFMSERDEARIRCREAAEVLIEAVGADGPCDVGNAARRVVAALSAARAAAIEECVKVCDAEARRWAELAQSRHLGDPAVYGPTRKASAECAFTLASRLRALLEPGT
jgi:hypothetical protein